MQEKNVTGANSLRHSLISPLFSLINVSATPSWSFDCKAGGDIGAGDAVGVFLEGGCLDFVSPWIFWDHHHHRLGLRGWGEASESCFRPSVTQLAWDPKSETQTPAHSTGDPSSGRLPPLSHHSFKVGEGLQAVRRHLCFSVQQTTLPFPSLGAPRTTSKQTDQPQGKPLEWGGAEQEEGALQPLGGDGISKWLTFAGKLG